MKAFGIIYKHTNKLNGKIYIGQTIKHQNPNRRFKKGSETYRSYKGSTAFQNALKKYTWEGFETELLFTAFDQETLNRAEEYFINLYNALLPNGYNSVSIVEGNIQYTEEVRAKISKAAKERFAKMEIPPEAPNKKEHVIINGVAHKNCAHCKQNKTLDLFVKAKGRWDGLYSYCKECNKSVNYNKYERMSPEDKARSIENKRGKLSEGVLKAYKENPHLRLEQAKRKSKAIVGTHVETGKEVEFSSALDAKKFGFDNTNIGQAIKKNKPYKKHTWRFK